MPGGTRRREHFFDVQVPDLLGEVGSEGTVPDLLTVNLRECLMFSVTSFDGDAETGILYDPDETSHDPESAIKALLRHPDIQAWLWSPEDSSVVALAFSEK